MKRTIGALTIILGLTTAGPLMAYPTQNGTANDNNNGQTGTTMHNATGAKNAERVKFDQVPQPVQNTITRHLQGSDVKHIERVTFNDGQTCYIVTAKTSDGNIQHFKVGADGQYQGEVTNKKWLQQNSDTTSQDQNSGGLRPRQEER